MSEFYSTAANRLDPHGRLLTPDMRAALEKNAHDSLLEMHSILKARSEEHTSELQSLMRISYAVFCLKKNNTISTTHRNTHQPNTRQLYNIVLTSSTTMYFV